VSESKILRLGEVRNEIAEGALRRYNEHKGRGRPDAEARNVAVSQTRHAMNYRYSADTIRRELSRLLDPAPGPRWGDPLQGTRPVKPRPWRLT
jgi:hypothetical protein